MLLIDDVWVDDQLGVGFTSGAPAARIESFASSGAQLRLSYTRGSVYADSTVDASGNLTINPSGKYISLNGSRLYSAKTATQDNTSNAEVLYGSGSVTEKVAVGAAGAGDLQLTTGTYYAVKFNSGTCTHPRMARLRCKAEAAVADSGYVLVDGIQTDSAGVPSGTWVVGPIASTGRKVFNIGTTHTDLYFGIAPTLTASTSYWLIFRAIFTGGLMHVDGYAADASNLFATSATGAAASWTASAFKFYMTLSNLSDYGVRGYSNSSHGVYGNSNVGFGLYGSSTNGYGVYGYSEDNIGVYGSSRWYTGGYFRSSQHSGLIALQDSTLVDNTTQDVMYVARSSTLAGFTSTGSILRVNQVTGTGPLFRAQVNGTDKVYIDSAGNAGFGGLTSLSHPIDVTGNIRYSGQLISTVATGTAPLSITSTTAVTNLNADLLDGQHGSYYTNYVQSRLENLVTNGNGFFGSNINFTGWTYDQVEVHGGAGCFKYTGTSTTKTSDEYIPVDPEKFYRFVVWAKAGDTGGTGYDAANRQYTGLVVYDIDQNSIQPWNFQKLSGSTDTTLASPLNTGDSVIVLTDATGWDSGAGANYNRQMVWWPYTNAKGYTYGDYTYSRNGTVNNSFFNTNGAWNAKSTNTLTLTQTWPGPNLAAGTKVRNASSGGTYKYTTMSNVQVPNAWTRYEGYIGGYDTTGANSTTLFPYGTAYVRLLFLANYAGGASAVIRYSDLTFNEIESWRDGSASLPSIAFAADVDTGIYRIGSGSIGVSSNGSLIATLDSAGLTLASGDALRMPDNGYIYDTGGSISRFAFSTGSSYNCRTGGTHIFQVNGSTVLTIGSTGQIISPLATGTAPLSITSTTVCTNLNADLLDGMHAPVSGNNGNTWGHVATVKSDGVMEIGRYLDFHHTSNDGADYAARLYTNGTDNNTLFFDGKLKVANGLMIATQNDLSSRFESGFFSTSSATTGENWPLTASWMHLIGATHSDTGTYYAFQFAADYFAQRFFVRSTNNSGATAWNRLIVSAADVTANGLAYGTTYGTIATTAAGTGGQMLFGQGAGNPPDWKTVMGDCSCNNTGGFTIANNAVTLGKMATMATNRLLGRQTTGTGIPEVLSLTSDSTLLVSWATAGTVSLGINPDANIAAQSLIFASSASNSATVLRIDPPLTGGYSGFTFNLNALGRFMWDDGFENAFNMTLTPDFTGSAPTLILGDTGGDAAISLPHLNLIPRGLTSVEGALTNDSAQNALAFRVNGTDSNVVRTIFTQHGIQSVTNTVTETTLIHATNKIGSLTIPANHLKVGKILRVKGKGYLGVTGSATFTLKLKTTSGVLGTFTGTISGVANDVLDIDCMVSVSSVGATGSLRTLGSVTLCQGSYAAPKALPISTIPTNLTVDTTAAQTLDITATWGTANVSNSVSLAHLTVEVIS